MLPRLIQSKYVDRLSSVTPCIVRCVSNYQEDYQFWQHSKVPTMHFQKSLPRLPIPDLPKTCERYLKAQRPLLKDSEFENTETHVKRFLSNEGIPLHEELKALDAKNKHTSYISEPWFDMYLRDRSSLPINYNPALVYMDDPKKEYNCQLIRATNLLISSLRFLKSLRCGILEPEVYHMDPKKSNTQSFRFLTRLLPPSLSWYGAYLFNAYPLDMSQFDGLFNATRIPKVDKDVIFRNHSSKHVLVLRNGNFFIFDVFDSQGNIKSPEHILGCIKFILDNKTPLSDFPLGLLTSENRNIWASARKHLETSGNHQVLQLIDSSIFCLCLDDASVGNAPEDILRLFLHSDGVNRWFDKSFSLIVTGDGKAGVNFEHSWGDGVAVLRYCQDSLKDSMTNPFVHPGSQPASSQMESYVQKLDIFCDDTTKKNILDAKKKYEAVINTLGVTGFLCDSFGKKLCKNAKVSPDSVMQLGFQVAYNKLSRGYAPTYESCSTSAFKHGRTETVRPCTVATKAFCEALRQSSRPSKEQLQKMLRTCSEVHGRLTKEAATGQGFDRHLFALRKIAERRNGPLPALFQDEAYARINYNILSTSTLSSEVLTVGGFGPVVKDGFGIGYGIMDNSLGALVTNYSGDTDGVAFVRCLEEAFQEIHNVLK